MAKRGTITAWLRKKISRLDYGVKWNGSVRHCNTNEEVLDHLRNKVKLSYLTNEKLWNHFNGELTLYYAGNSWDDETLVNIDIDCHHGIGSLAGAMAYAQWLKDNFFPGLYFEPSTNGKGVHAYFILAKYHLPPAEVNKLLARLEAFLRTTSAGFDIENVEIKGRCPVIIWGNRRGEVANYKAGVLAKIPRQADRFEELKATTRLTVNELIKLMSQPVPQLQVVEPMKEEAQPHVNLVVEELPCTKDVPSKKLPKVRTTKLTKLKKPSINLSSDESPQRKAVGSCSDRVISAEELEKLKGHYLTVAQTLLGTHPIKTGRVVATAEDLAVFLMLLKYFTGNMNQDGSLPWARFKGLWDALFNVGDITRAFDAKRFAALRNYLSSLGLLDWSDETYHPEFCHHTGTAPGKACKWKAGLLLMNMLDEEHVSNQREQETSLTGAPSSTSLQQTVQSLTMLPFSETTRPIWVIPTALSMPTMEEWAEVAAILGLAA
jgi:hypothetical protein